MGDPFARALAVLHGSAGSLAAVYTPIGGDPVQIRVIREQGSREVGTGPGRRILQDPNHLSIMRSDVAQPAKGDTVAIGGEVLRINAAPELDIEGMSWLCPAEPV